MYLRKINNYTRSDLLLCYITHAKGKINSDSTRRVSLSFYIAKKTLGSVETRTVLTNSRKCKEQVQEQLCCNKMHTVCNIYFLEPTVRGDEVTSTSEVRYDGTKTNSAKNGAWYSLGRCHRCLATIHKTVNRYLGTNKGILILIKYRMTGTNYRHSLNTVHYQLFVFTPGAPHQKLL